MKANMNANVAAQNARMWGLVFLRFPQCGTRQTPVNLKGLNSVHLLEESTGTSKSTVDVAAAMFRKNFGSLSHPDAVTEKTC